MLCDPPDCSLSLRLSGFRAFLIDILAKNQNVSVNVGHAEIPDTIVSISDFSGDVSAISFQLIVISIDINEPVKQSDGSW